MDLSVLLSALTSNDQALRESNPFSPLETATDGIGQALLKNAANYSTEENIWGGLATGLLSGFAGNLASGYQDKQNATVSDLLGRALQGQSVFERPGEVPPSVFSKLVNTGALVHANDEFEATKARIAAGQALQGKILDKKLDIVSGNNPIQAEQRMGALNNLLGGNTAQTQTPGAQPGSPDYLQQAGGDETLARYLEQRDVEKPDRLQNLRKEFETRPEVQSFITSNIGFQSLQKAIKDPFSTSDLELVRGAIQAIEPGMAVREGEQAAVAASGDIPSAWKAQLNKALTGESGLNEDVRNGIMRIAERRFNAYAENFNKARGFYEKQATAAKLDPTGISYVGEVTPSNAFGSSPAAATGGRAQDLQRLAKSFPNTPEGREQFKAAAAMLLPE